MECVGNNRSGDKQNRRLAGYESICEVQITFEVYNGRTGPDVAQDFAVICKFLFLFLSRVPEGDILVLSNARMLCAGS